MACLPSNERLNVTKIDSSVELNCNVPLIQFQDIFNKLMDNKKSKEDKEKRTSALREQGKDHLIVSALITTVTYAAGFTLPGGYNGDDGKAILSKKAAFGAFVVTDTIAMVSSLCAVFLHFFMTMRNGEEFLAKHLVWAFILTMIGMGAMAIAFATGLYAVLPHSSTLAFSSPLYWNIFKIGEVRFRAWLEE